MRLIRSGALIYMDVEAAKRLSYYLDIAYNELDNDDEQAENSLLGNMLQDVIAHQEDYQDPRLYAPDPSDFSSRPIGCNSEHFAACRSCTDPMRGMYAHCPLYPPEVIPDGTKNMAPL